MTSPLTKKQKNRLRRLALVTQEGEKGLIKEINLLEDTMEAEIESIKTTAQQALNVAETTSKTEIRGEDGKDGEIGPQGERGVDGRDGKDGLDGKDGTNGLDGVNGKDGIDGKDGKDGSPDTPKQIKEKLESLEGDERLDKKAIKGLDEEVSRLDKRIDEKPSGIGGGVKQLMAAPFSFSGDGATTQFYLPTEPLGKGWFLFAHYQGQWLQKDIHFALNRKIFDTSAGTSPFVPEVGTVIEGFIIF